MENGTGMDLQWFFKGFFEEPMQLDQAIASVAQKDDGVTVKINNVENWVCPVDVQITCVDGSVHDYKLPVTIWAWSNQHTHFFPLSSKALSVVIDSKEAYPDVNYENNVWYSSK